MARTSDSRTRLSAASATAAPLTRVQKRGHQALIPARRTGRRDVDAREDAAPCPAGLDPVVQRSVSEPAIKGLRTADHAELTGGEAIGG
jgi:hypothetical protein